MPDTRPTLLLTRPVAQSRRFAEAFAARFGVGWPILIAPLQQIVALRPPIPNARELVFTSENAVAPLVALAPAAARRAWCVGARTAEVAARAGFAAVTGPGNAAALAQMIAAAHPEGPILVARGEHQAFDISAALDSVGVATVSAQVYAQRAVAPSAEATALLRGDGALLVPLFSPRSAWLFAKAAQGARAPLWIAAISPAAAAAGATMAPARIETARRPDADAMLDAIARLIAG